ncbi:glycoside hydrolase family 3 C-terminal domain-containing protein [Roseivirga sp. BDSF3-8]|uniref:glycoside hydrolase family 3 C-terminal domain-containing protein n=1 Tax=Roseivirga sp. BDSF3-8 TaxID=3241598 RepID=UPI0035326FBE
MKHILLFLATLLFMTSYQASVAQKPPKLGKASIDEVIAAMTPEEKATLLVGPGMPGYAGLTPVEGAPEARVPGAAGGTMAIERLGIPAIVVADGPAGLRISPTREGDKNTYYATAFPVGTALASTWNTPLIEKVGKAIGEEVKEYGVDVLLAPALNIHRNPLNGRNFEYYSEDPLLSGKIAAAYVNGVESNGVGTSIKHFAANNQETNRLSVNANISERAMRELYLRGFEIAVKEAQPWTVMTAYNRINGTYASERKDLLLDILRDEWGFEGFVMTDWFGGYEGFQTIQNGVSDVVAQAEAGNDLLMPGMQRQRDALAEAIRKGEVSEEAVNRNLKNILNVVLMSPTFKKVKYRNQPDLKANAQVTRQAGAEGMVLLKNEDNVLPLATGSYPIAVFGNTAYNFIAGGTGSGDVNEAYTVSLIEGLENAGYSLDEELSAAYTPFMDEAMKKEMARREKEGGLLATPQRIAEMPLDRALIEKKAEAAGVALITIGRNSGENADRQISDDFYLAQDEIQLINKVSKAFHAQGKKVVVILNVGGVIETASWKDKVDAILLAWQPGQEGGNSVADVLSGEVNPSGKLPMTFPVDYNHHASAAYWLGEPAHDPKEVSYIEDIYVGYRYFNTFDIPVSYPFGYGQSYTTFAYTDPELSNKVFDDKLEVTVTVTNTGDAAGKEVVQLYLSAPDRLVDKPEAELKGFAKTRELAPGESQTLTFTLSPRHLASFVDEQSAWVASAGEYTVKIGASSLDIRQQDTFTLNSELIAEKVNKTFDNVNEIEVLKNR